MPERPQAWSPSNVHAVVSGVQVDATIGQPSGTPPARSYPPDTVPSTRHAMANQKRRGQGTDERHGRHSDTLDRHDHEDGPPGHAEPLRWGRRLRLGKLRLTRRWQHCQRDRNHGSDQAAAWCRSTVQAAPRRIALLGQCRVERRANGEASSVMAWLAGAVRVTWTRFGCWCVAEQGSSHMPLGLGC